MICLLFIFRLQCPLLFLFFDFINFCFTNFLNLPSFLAFVASDSLGMTFVVEMGLVLMLDAPSLKKEPGSFGDHFCC